MKKIIAAFDGLKFSESTMDYSIYLAKTSGAHLVGVFLDDAAYSSYKIYELISDGMVDQVKLKKLVEKDKTLRKHAAEKFETTCQKAGIHFSIHHDRKIATNELVHESIYADLLILDRKETLTHYEESAPTRFIRNLLADVQCPVLVVAGKFTGFGKNILLYDGGPSSVHAIKMFDYTLSFLKNTDTEVLSVKNINSTLHLPDNKLMKEFVKRHFPNAKYQVLQGFPETEIIKYLKEQSADTVVVLGAYRRNAVSRFFKQSMADSLMIETTIPLFIAHNK